jgi:hypothetical protein
MFRSFAVLIIALTFVVGPGWFVPTALDCPRCAEHCPMKKPKLGCHSEHGAQAPCRSGQRFASGACDHGTAVAPLSREVALSIPAAPLRADETPSALVDVARLSPEAPILDPPLDPPRSRFSA